MILTSFAVSETWLDSTVTDLEVEIPGYDVYRLDRHEKTGGGVCSSVWSNTSASNIHKLPGTQNFAARTVSGTRKFDHVTPGLKNLRWIPVKSHLYLRDAILYGLQIYYRSSNKLS